MRSHGQIINEVGISKTAETLGLQPGTVKQWKRGDSIPAGYWKALRDHGLATLEELAAAAESRRRATPVAA